MAEEIRAYLSSHPNAADTLEGIVRWWLARKRFEEAWQTVQAALEQLVREGVLEMRVTPGGAEVYAAGRKRQNRNSH